MAPAVFRYNWEHSAFLCASLQDLLRKVPRNQDLLWQSLQTLASGSFPLKSGVYIAENQQFNGQKLPAAPEYGVMVLPKAEITQILSLTKAVFLRRGLFGWLGLFLPQTISVTLLIPLPLRVLHRTSWRDDTEEGEGATPVRSFSNQLWNENIPTRGSPLWNCFQNMLKTRSLLSHSSFNSQKLLIQN